MFKSINRAALSLLIICFCSLNPVLSQGVNDSIDPVINKGTGDSTLLILQSEEFNQNLNRLIMYQKSADSLYRQSVEMRKEASRIDDPVSRGQLQKKIILVEDSVQVLRALADEQYLLLNEKLPGHGNDKTGPTSVHPFLVKDTVLNGITVYHYDLNEDLMDRLEEIRKPLEPGESGITTEIPVSSKEKKESSGPGSGSSNKYPGLVLSDKSPYGKEKYFEEEFTIPPGVFYRIQLAVYRKLLPADHFGGISPITTEYIPARDLTRYFAGKFSRMNDARAALVKVKARGFTDAFIIGYYNGTKASFSKLEALEK